MGSSEQTKYVTFAELEKYFVTAKSLVEKNAYLQAATFLDFLVDTHLKQGSSLSPLYKATEDLQYQCYQMLGKMTSSPMLIQDDVIAVRFLLRFLPHCRKVFGTDNRIYKHRLNALERRYNSAMKALYQKKDTKTIIDLQLQYTRFMETDIGQTDIYLYEVILLGVNFFNTKEYDKAEQMLSFARRIFLNIIQEYKDIDVGFVIKNLFVTLILCKHQAGDHYATVDLMSELNFLQRKYIDPSKHVNVSGYVVPLSPETEQKIKALEHLNQEAKSMLQQKDYDRFTNAIKASIQANEDPGGALFMPFVDANILLGHFYLGGDYSEEVVSCYHKAVRLMKSKLGQRSYLYLSKLDEIIHRAVTARKGQLVEDLFFDYFYARKQSILPQFRAQEYYDQLMYYGAYLVGENWENMLVSEKLENAEKIFQEALQHGKNNNAGEDLVTNINSQLRRAYLRSGKIGKAFEIAQARAKGYEERGIIDLSYAFTLAILAEIHMNSGRLFEAIETAEKAIEMADKVVDKKAMETSGLNYDTLQMMHPSGISGSNPNLLYARLKHNTKAIKNIINRINDILSLRLSELEGIYAKTLLVDTSEAGHQKPSFPFSDNFATRYEYELERIIGMVTIKKDIQELLERINQTSNILSFCLVRLRNHEYVTVYPVLKYFLLRRFEEIKEVVLLIGETKREEFISVLFSELAIVVSIIDGGARTVDLYQLESEISGTIFDWLTMMKDINAETTLKIRNNFYDVLPELSEEERQKEQLKRFNLEIGKLDLTYAFLTKRLTAESAQEKKEKIILYESEIMESVNFEFDANYNHIWKQIQDALEEDEAYIELAQAREFDFISTKWSQFYAYMAIVIEKKAKYPKVVFIDHPNAIHGQGMINYQHSLFGPETKAYYSSIFPDNKPFDEDSKYNPFELIWRPLQKTLHPEIKTVTICPDDIYWRINFETLKNPKTGNFLLDEININLVPNASHFFIKEDPKRPANGIALFGNPDFTFVSGESKGQDIGVKLNVSDLPGTESEVMRISEILTSKGIQHDVFLNEKASKTTFSNLKRCSIIHIATHGYYHSPTSEDHSLQKVLGATFYKLSSGLILAGANQGIWEGVLTSYELTSQGSLANTDLVVLSACETGRGELIHWRGVHGLVNSLFECGVKNIIVSLWKVSDQATAELMSLFYQALLEEYNIANALKKAKLQLKEKYNDPLFWGGFIHLGPVKNRIVL